MAAFFQNEAFVDNTCRISSLRLRQRLMRSLIGASIVLVGWSVIEPGMYLIAACLLCLRPIFVQVTGKWHKARLYHGVLSKKEHSRQSDTQGLHRTALAPAHSEFTKMCYPRKEHVIVVETALPHQSMFLDPATPDHDIELGFTPSSQPHEIRIDKNFRDTTLKRGDMM